MQNEKNTDIFSTLERFSRLYRLCIQNRLAPYSIKPGQLAILKALWSRDGVNQKQLLAVVEVEQPTLANTLKRMQKDGLITRQHDPADKRKCIYSLTERGKKARNVVGVALSDIREICETGLSVNDLGYFGRILVQMSERLKDDLTDPALILADVVIEE